MKKKGWPRKAKPRKRGRKWKGGNRKKKHSKTANSTRGEDKLK